jgi:alpha-ribazole phosphatase
MSRRLLLVRHGRIGDGQGGRFVGRSDPALDGCGEAQARQLARRVQQFAPQRCYCSPLRRCQQTAAILMPHVRLQEDERLREIDFGRWENRTFAEIAQAEPEAVARWAAADADFAFPEGERIAAFRERVARVAEYLVGVQAETVLAVTHGGVIRAMICHLLGLDPRKYVAFAVGYATMAVIDLCAGQGVLVGLEPAGAVEVGHG